MLTTQPTNTKKKMMYDLNTVLKFLHEVQNKERKLENIPPEEVNIIYLSEFIIAARTKRGERYEPSSFRGILSRVDFYLTRGEYGKRLFTDPEFMWFGDTLKAKQKEQKKQGTHSWTIFSTLKEKFRIYALPCNMLYISYTSWLVFFRVLIFVFSFLCT